MITQLKQYSFMEIEQFPWSWATFIKGKWVRISPVPKPFFAYYEFYKEQIRHLGIVMSKSQGEWILKWSTLEKPIQVPDFRYELESGHNIGATTKALTLQEQWNIEREQKILTLNPVTEIYDDLDWSGILF